jgi:hypothetical protein
MDLGAFSISLAVRNLRASRAFYQRLGFVSVGGDQNQGWLIMKNGMTVIGLFQGMFKNNVLTFHPGWDYDANPLPSFTDIREIQRVLMAQGISPIRMADPQTTGPEHLILADPDGNHILLDQRV